MSRRHNPGMSTLTREQFAAQQRRGHWPVDMSYREAKRIHTEAWKKGTPHWLTAPPPLDRLPEPYGPEQARREYLAATRGPVRVPAWHDTPRWRAQLSNPPQQFYNDPDDIQWLRETHLRNVLSRVQHFRSFVISGNEDWPNEVRLYRQLNPEIVDRPVQVWIADDHDGWDIPQRYS